MLLWMERVHHGLVKLDAPSSGVDLDLDLRSWSVKTYMDRLSWAIRTWGLHWVVEVPLGTSCRGLHLLGVLPWAHIPWA
jgi:hypothetical protein